MKINLNENYEHLGRNYLFSEIARRVASYREKNPGADLISLGIGDVTQPLSSVVTEAMHRAVDEMATATGFHGYAPDFGYDFLRSAVSGYYRRFGVDIPADDIYISDGAKSDLGNIVELFGDCDVVVPDPVYPVYVDSNVMSGRSLHYMSGSREHGLLPMPGDSPVSGAAIYYFCSPNNPTGAVYTREQLREWVDFCLANGSLMLFDAAYASFIQSDVPHSVYEIPGAERCAVEFCSFSKMAGFTGTRCAFTVFPSALTHENGTQLAAMWQRRQATKFNGVAYVVQRGAEAALSEAGQAACMQTIAYYHANAQLLTAVLQRAGIAYTGGENAPYIFFRCPGGKDSWDFFDELLTHAELVGTPGSGFGKAGEGCFRLTCFGTHENTKRAAERLDRFFETRYQ